MCSATKPELMIFKKEDVSEDMFTKKQLWDSVVRLTGELEEAIEFIETLANFLDNRCLKHDDYYRNWINNEVEKWLNKQDRGEE